ncbi:MAG: hypothetical protein WDW38_005352 [Sanguina aurantia]
MTMAHSRPQANSSHHARTWQAAVPEPDPWWAENLDSYLYDYDYFIPEEADALDPIYDPLIRMGYPCPIHGCGDLIQFIQPTGSRQLLQNTGFGNTGPVGQVVGAGGIPAADYTPYSVSAATEAKVVLGSLLTPRVDKTSVSVIRPNR